MFPGVDLCDAPCHSHYAAIKAYDIVLAESLWYEFSPYNVDALACAVGLTSSPGLKSSMEHKGTAKRVYMMAPEQVVYEGSVRWGRNHVSLRQDPTGA